MKNRKRGAVTLVYFLLFLCIFTKVFYQSLSTVPRLVATNGTEGFVNLYGFRFTVILIAAFLAVFAEGIRRAFLGKSQELLRALPIFPPLVVFGRYAGGLASCAPLALVSILYLFSFRTTKLAWTPFIFGTVVSLFMIYLFSLLGAFLVVSILTPFLGKRKLRFIRGVQVLTNNASWVFFIGLIFVESQVKHFVLSLYKFGADHLHFLPTYWLARALAHFSLANTPPAGLNMMGVIFLLLVLTVISYRVAVKYVNCPVPVQHAPYHTKLDILENNPLLKALSPATRGLLVKDLKCLVRENSAVWRALAQIVGFSAFFLWTNKQLGIVSPSAQRYVQIQAMFFLMALPALLALTIVTPAFGMEKRAAAFMATIVLPSRLFKQKLMLNLFLLLLAAALSLVIIKVGGIIFGIGLQHLGSYALVLLSSTLFFALLAIGTAFKYPDFKKGKVLVIGLVRFIILSGISLSVGLACAIFMMFFGSLLVKVGSLSVLITMVGGAYYRALKAVRVFNSLDY